MVEVGHAPASGQLTLPGIGSVKGLMGLREQVGAFGRTLEARPTPDRAWRRVTHLRRVAAAAS